MKNRSIKLFAAASLVSLAIGGAGCGKISDFGDTNTNPNSVTSPVTAALLTNALQVTGPNALGVNTFQGPRAALYCQYISETQYTDAQQYSLPILESGALYSGTATIPGPLMDLKVIINRNSDPTLAAATSVYGSNANQISTAKILSSYYLWTITDKWGDVPYSEALQGAANLFPKYDMQLDIYKGLFKDLADAVAGFDGGLPVRGDIVYSGNIASWKKFANSLRVVMAMRLSKQYPNAGELAATEFAAALAPSQGGVITTNAENFKVDYSNGGGVYNHPWFDEYFTNVRDDYALSKTMADCLAGLGDTRRSAFGSTQPGAPGIAFPYGLTRDLATAFTTSIGGPSNYARVLESSKRTAGSPVVVLNASTVLLAQAEAVQRGWITGSAQALYEAGVTASFGEWGLTVPAGYFTGAASFTSGGGVPAIGQAPAPYDAIPADQDAATPTALSRIQLQRWLAAFPNGGEGWAEWRRTGVPDLKPTRFATNSGKGIPRRYMYGPSESSLNGTNLAAAIARLTGGDVAEARVWWDKP